MLSITRVLWCGAVAAPHACGSWVHHTCIGSDGHVRCMALCMSSQVPVLGGSRMIVSSQRAQVVVLEYCRAAATVVVWQLVGRGGVGGQSMSTHA